MKQLKEAIEWVGILSLALLLALGMFYLLGIVLYIWWVNGVLIFLGITVVIISYVLYKVW